MIHYKKMFSVLACYFCMSVHVALCRDFSVEQFMREAPKAWKLLEEEYRKGYDSTSVCLYGQPSDGVDEIINPRQETLKNALLGKSEITIVVCPINEYLNCINERYGFDIKRNREDGNWMLDSITQQPVSMLFGNIGILQGSMAAFGGIMVEGAWMDAIVNSEGFKATKIESVLNNELGESSCLVKVFFSSAFDADEHNRVLSGTFWFDPAHFWVLTRYEIHLKSDTLGTAAKSFRYRMIEGVPFPEKIILDYKFEGDPPIRYVTEYTDMTNKVDQSIFYLSHYGFSEPVDPMRGITMIHSVLIAVGILLIILGLYLRWLAWRKT